jgi:Fic family protein
MWNWQQPDWPNFSWDKALLRKAEEHFLKGTGMFAGTLKHLGSADREQLLVEAISAEAVTTSEIEGEILDRASVQSSIRRQTTAELPRTPIAGDRRDHRDEPSP